MATKRSEPEAAVYPPYASLIIWGEQLDPEWVTKLLAISPDRSFRKGDPRGSSGQVWHHGSWQLESCNKLDSLDVAAHLKWLVDRLVPRAAQLAEVLQNRTLDAEISCFWIMPGPNKALVFEANLLERLGALGIPLEIDIYGP